MIQKGHTTIKGAKALILGITFKENCPDVRNTKVVDIFHELQQYGLEVDIYDPLANAAEVKHEYGLEIISVLDKEENYAAVIVAVAHDEFKILNYQGYKDKNVVIFDTKAFVQRDLVDARL
jgi:UDP-N-acetyl-D-galactosamine dehydrogenase